MLVQLLVQNQTQVCNKLVVRGIPKMESMLHSVLRRDLNWALPVTSTDQDVPHFHTQNTQSGDFDVHPVQHWWPQVEVEMLLPYFLALS
jgi:hypothetical protein